MKKQYSSPTLTTYKAMPQLMICGSGNPANWTGPGTVIDDIVSDIQNDFE